MREYSRRIHDLTWQCHRGGCADLQHLLEAQRRSVSITGRQLTVQAPPISFVRDAMVDIHKTWSQRTRAKRAMPRSKQCRKPSEKWEQ